MIPTSSGNLPDGPGTVCLNCGSPLASDQRYCLACGHPASPVRLAFLDVLQAEQQLRPSSPVVAPGAGYVPAGGYGPPVPPEPDGPVGRLRRYSGLFGLSTVLLLAILVGLLIGHWASGGKGSSPSVVKIEGLTAPTAVATGPATTPTDTTSTPSATSKASSKAAEKAEEESEKEKAPVAAPPVAKKPSKSTLDKLSTSKGKQHQEEINKLTEGGQPIETGGGGSSTPTTSTPKSSGESGGGPAESIE